MASPLPSPGQLIIENVELLAGSPDAFPSRYGYTLTPDTFSKPGTTGPAAAVLHFLLCIIDSESAHIQFKPCFPILDRQQERDFRSVVDSQLSALEKTKLLPVGAARKSVVASAGGDRFIDLLWSLSNLAVQQACMRQSAYGQSSRLRLLSQQTRTESNLSQQSSVRSVRSFVSATARPDRSDPSRQRRFLGVGMLTASQQRAKDAEDIRSRIDAEKATLARTTEMGKREAKTWASEADSLREKIGEFEAKVRRLKGQLADMGFDENGVDIRNMGQNGSTDSLRAGSDSSCSQIRQSSSGEDLGELKTSPIESMESGSSVDELLEPVEGCDDIATDLTRLMNFSTETRELRTAVDGAFPSRKPAIEFPGNGNSGNPKDVVDFVRAATAELEEATNRMNQMREARLKAEAAQSPIDSNEGSPRVENDAEPVNGNALGELVNSALARHKEVVESSRILTQAANELTEQSQADMRTLSLGESSDSSQNTDPVATVSKPTWLTEATADAPRNSSLTEHGTKSKDGIDRCIADSVDTAKDVQLTAGALQKSSPRRATNVDDKNSSSNRRKKKPKQSSSRHTRTRSTASTSHESLSVPMSPQAMEMAGKTPRSVRFADLPPSYSANKPLLPGAAPGAQPQIVQEGLPKSPDGEPLSREMINVKEELDMKQGSDGNQEAREKKDYGVRQTKDVSRPVQLDTTSDSVKASEQRRRSERKDVTRRDFGNGPRPYHHRGNSSDERIDGLRVASASSQSQTRASRGNIPRNMIRRKEAIARSVAPTAGARALNSQQLAFGNQNRPRGRETSFVGTPRPEVEKVSGAATVALESDGDSVPHIEIERHGSYPELRTIGSVNEEVTFEKTGLGIRSTMSSSMDNLAGVPKRLFQTPDSAMASANRPISKAAPVRLSDVSSAPGSSIRSKRSTTVTSAITSERRESRSSSIPSSPKRGSIGSSSPSDRYAPAPNAHVKGGAKPPLVGRTSKGEGFFAGETAQWQQNVRTRSSMGGPAPPQAASRPSAESFASAPKVSGKMSSKGWSGSPKKSRVQSLRARLAAVLK